jgi:predicted DCC family thiol-disulfide oxidoreductase YuxK
MDEKSIKLPVILFDPECPLCVRFKVALERMNFDEPIFFQPLNSQIVIDNFPHLSQEELSKEVHLILDEKGIQSLKGAEVIEYLAKHNESIKKLSWLLESNVGEKASHLFYNTVNKLRESLHNHCSNCRK